MESAQVPPVRTLAHLVEDYVSHRTAMAQAETLKAATLAAEAANMKSACRRAAQALGLSGPDCVPLTACWDIPETTEAHLRQTGAKPRSRYNYKAVLKRLVKWGRGRGYIVDGPERGMSEAWRALDSYAKPPEFSNTRCLRRFAKFCTKRGIEPSRVTSELSKAFYAHLGSPASGVRYPHKYYLSFERVWTRLVRQGRIPDTSQIHSASKAGKRVYALPYEGWPEKLKSEEAERWRWATSAYAARRRSTCRQNPVSAGNTRATLERIAGFAVSELGIDLTNYGLRDIVCEDLLVKYLNWLERRLGAVTCPASTINSP